MKKIISVEAPDINPELIDSIYQLSEMEGVIRWFIDWMKSENLSATNNIAPLYGIIKDSDSVIEYLEKGCEMKEYSVVRINNNPDFNFLRTDPRFIKLLKKMHLQ